MKINVKLPLLIAISAIIAGVIISAWSYSRIEQAAELESQNTLNSLSETVYNTAAAAAYLDDEPLAKDVVAGLLKNKIVDCAVINTQKIETIVDVNCGSRFKLTKQLYSPFESDRVVGELILYENSTELNNRVLKQFYSAAINVFAIICMITLLSLVVTYLLVSHPISQLAEVLKTIDFTEDSSARLDSAQRKDEIGSIRNVINKMLAKLDERLQHERNLVLQTEKLSSNFKMICELSTSALVVTDSQLVLKSVNPKFMELWVKNTGLAEVIYDDHWLERISFEMAALKEQIISHPAKATSRSMEVEIPSPNGSRVESSWHEITFTKAENRFGELNIFIIINDISEQKQKYLRTEFEADHDTLTSLKNRRSTRRLVESMIEREDPISSFVLVLIDLDGFKEVNDHYGHDAGDAVLREIAKRYRDLTRKSDIICRWGGDEFVMILGEVSQKEAANIAAKILAATRLPFSLDKDSQAVVGASIGLACYPQDSMDFDKLFDKADHAMYQIKKTGKDDYAFFTN